jgi:hypothetical protein
MFSLGFAWLHAPKVQLQTRIFFFTSPPQGLASRSVEILISTLCRAEGWVNAFELMN